MVLDTRQIILVKQINDVFQQFKKPMSIGFLIRKFQEVNRFNQKQFFGVIDLMKQNELIKELKNGKLVLSYEWAPYDTKQVMTGKVSVLYSGSAFVKLIDQHADQHEEKYFVHKSNLNGAIDGDVVQFSPLIKKNTSPELKLPDGGIVRVQAHTKTKFVGTFLLNDQTPWGYSVLPDNFQTVLPIKIDNISGLQHNERIYFEITEFTPDWFGAKIIKKLGNLFEIDAEVEAILLNNNAPKEFSDLVNTECEKICQRDYDQSDKINYQSVEDLSFITIDPATAKDYDDAIYVKKINNQQYRLVVAIASVSSYVKPATELDKCAKKRGFSVYLHDRVIPMLPSCLSDDLCSLNEKNPKKVYVADMLINQSGEFINFDVYPAIMKNYRCCNYDEINLLLEPNDHQEISSSFDQNIITMVNEAYELSQILQENKVQRGAIMFDFPEVKPIYNQKENKIEIVVKRHKTAEKMIENFMIAANEVVTLFASKHKLPFIYRVHSGPNKDFVEDFLKIIKKIGVPTPTFDLITATPKQLSGWLDLYREQDFFNLLSRFVLRIMGKAQYSNENTFHYALALKNYTHFTSPIRRYADLMVHRIFEMYIFSVNNYSDEERKQLKNDLPELCKTMTELEIKSLEIERKVNTFLFCKYMEDHIGSCFEGTIVGLQSFGMFVELENMIEGFVHITQINENDFFVLNEDDFCFVGEKTGRKYFFGNKIKVMVVGVDKRFLRVNLKIVENN